MNPTAQNNKPRKPSPWIFVPALILIVLAWFLIFLLRKGPNAPDATVSAAADNPVTAPPGPAQPPHAVAEQPGPSLYFSSFDDDSIYKLDETGAIKSFVSGLAGPGCMTFDSAGNLYVSNYWGDSITQITPAGVKSTYAADFDHPSGILFDKKGNLYVANTITNIITRVAPDGAKTTFATGLSRPTQMIFDPAENMYVANGDTGRIFRIPAGGGDKVLVARLSEGTCGLVMDKAGNLFAGVGTWSFDDGVIYKITPGCPLI